MPLILCCYDGTMPVYAMYCRAAGRVAVSYTPLILSDLFVSISWLCIYSFSLWLDLVYLRRSLSNLLRSVSSRSKPCKPDRSAAASTERGAQILPYGQLKGLVS